MNKGALCIGLCVLGITALFLFKEGFLTTRKPSCELSKAPVKCFMDEVYAQAQKNGVESALAYAIDRVGPYNRNALHMSMHMIGQMAYNTFGDRARAMQILPPEAFNTSHLTYDGFQHGVLQAFFVGQKGVLTVEELVSASCSEYWVVENDPRSPSAWKTALGCFHGIGHALMAMYENDSNKSIAVCATLPHYWMQQRCAYGVFMEVSYGYAPAYSEHAHGGHVGKAPIPMSDVCANTPHLREVCAQFVGHTYLLQNPDDYAGAFDTCAKLPRDNDVCNIYLAEVILPGTTNDFDALQTQCSSSGTFARECVQWVALGIEEGYGGKNVRGSDFCSALSDGEIASCKAFLTSFENE